MMSLSIKITSFVCFLCFLFCLDLDLDLDRYVANHPFTGIGTTVGGAQFAGSWL